MKPFDTLTPGTSALGAGLAFYLAALARERGVNTTLVQILASTVRALILATEEGHACLRLSTLDGSPARLREDLLATGLVGRSDETGQAPPLPLVLDAANRLYLYRYHDYERRLALAVRRFALAADALPDEQAAAAALAHYFAANNTQQGSSDIDDQKVAAALALLRPLSIISGGPGTGKTTTVLAILACLLSARPDLRIALSAPTGKAAARLLESLRERAMGLDASLRARLPDQSYTIHRLLRPIPDTGRFRHDATNPLPIDLLVVDEASMLDLALATKLFEALPAHARLILLGDKDQLAAVEAGAVFHALAANPGVSAAQAPTVARLCAVSPDRLTLASGHDILAGTTTWFRRNYRFAADSAVGTAAALLRGDEAAAGATLAGLLGDPASAARLAACPAGALPAALLNQITDGYESFIEGLRGGDDAAGLIRRFEQHRVLCVVRQGERGVVQLNAELTRRVVQRAGRPVHPADVWFAGRPIIILQNDYALQLFNGDIGIAMPDDKGRMLVWFTHADGQMRTVAAARLPAHETAFASTVHKAQGSEFQSVSVILPSRDNPLLTREMLYTAVTRARAQVTLYGDAALLAKAAATSSAREGGLGPRLGSGA